MKNILIFFALLVVAACTILAVKYGRNASQAQGELDQERYSRMVAEEGLEKAGMKVTSLESELNRTQAKLKGLESLIKETKSLNSDLKAQLEKSSQINDELDRRIQDIQQRPVVAQESPLVGNP